MAKFYISANVNEALKSLKHLQTIAKLSNLKKTDLPKARESFLQVAKSLTKLSNFTITKGKDHATFA